MNRVAYIKIESKFKIKNGLPSDLLTFTIVQQGCLLSILFYKVASEILANFINANKIITLGELIIMGGEGGDNDNCNFSKF